MATYTTSVRSLSMTRSQYVSTLPPWRRLLAMLNWRPVYDIEQETERLRQEVKQLRESNARIDRFERELFSSSTRTPFTDDSSPT